MHSSLPVLRRKASATAAGAPAAPRPAAWLNAVLEQHDEREEMVRSQIEARGVEDERVLDALRTVPRHRFVQSARAMERMRIRRCRSPEIRRSVSRTSSRS